MASAVARRRELRGERNGAVLEFGGPSVTMIRLSQRQPGKLQQEARTDMAVTELHNGDTTHSLMSNCFPAKSLFRSRDEGAGHWRVAHKTVQQRRFRAMVCSASNKKTSRSDRKMRTVTPRTRCGSPDKTLGKQENILDGLFLMKTHYVERPTDLCSVDVSDKNLTSATEEELMQFNCVAYINAAENLLTLEAFRTFPALRELELSMNGISRVTVKAGDFPHLEVLDLSYNNLSPGDVSQLGNLSHLRVLHLTGNGLTHFPPYMSVSHINNAEPAMFPRLEILMLDDNKLSHSPAFVSLANLTRLKQLNLDRNGISEIPYMIEIELADSMCSPFRGGTIQDGEGPGGLGGSIHRIQENEKREEDLDEKTEGESFDYLVFPNAEDPDRTEVIFTSNNLPKDDPLLKPPDLAKSYSLLPNLMVATTRSLESFSRTVLPPFPELRYLSLADNKIAYEESLLPAALFPCLEELVIHGNPLTTLRSGDPPLLKSFLQQRLGINIIRRKTSGLEKPHIFIPVNAKRKVKTHIPKIPKQPLMLEPPSNHFLGFPSDSSDSLSSRKEFLWSPDPLPPIKSSSGERSNMPSQMSQGAACSPETSMEEEISTSSDPGPGVESVFMTQVDGLPDPPPTSSALSASLSDEAVRDEKEDVAQILIPEKFKGYEELFNVKTDPDFIEPVGIQNNVRALEYALKHLLVYRDAKPRLHSLQKPYIPRETKFGTELSSLPRKNKKQILEEILISMREPKHLTQVPLESILRRKTSTKAYKEAQVLLKEVRVKYRLFHAESVKRATELETSWQETARDLKEAQSHRGYIQEKVKTESRWESMTDDY
ncbi:X-ray radiation resistance-associated protein 1 isoform X2 [Ascaphus truei]|uniref:X-ray radiation resistance-associated protein 1 isoform X2 n=1 Tax=Ascaphus truei TaxID=8439 RepID=UPI003F5948DE